MEAHTYYTSWHGQLALLHDGMKTHSMQMTETLYRNPKKEKHIHIFHINYLDSLYGIAK